jgi:hypothetical protein
MYLPHWTVEGQRTSSQFDAWRAANKLGIMPQFYFYEEEYDTLDWTAEPSEHWDELCYERCITLRQRYNKLSLFYSAGRDSHHILKCFYYFKIPLDEIVLLNLKTNPIRQDQLIRHIYPQVHNFLREYPNTKITVVNVGPEQYEEYFKEDWLEHSASALVHGYFQPTNFSYYVKSILHADQPNHGIILGVDKPRIIIENNKYYSTVIDKTLETFLTDIPNIELFYYAPDMPKLHLKQSWMLLNHIEKTYGSNSYSIEQLNPFVNSRFLSPSASASTFTINTAINTRKTNTITNDFLKEYCGNSHSDYYDDYCIGSGRGGAWDINLSIQNGKSKHKLNGREPVFQQVLQQATDQNWASAHNFNDAMNYLKTSFPKIFNKEDPYQGTLGVYSKKYYMKDVT